jgi:hypothetical protein
MRPQSFLAIRAAQNHKTWGRQAALRYCQRRGVPLRLYYLARQLEAAGSGF